MGDGKSLRLNLLRLTDTQTRPHKQQKQCRCKIYTRRGRVGARLIRARSQTAIRLPDFHGTKVVWVGFAISA